ncbi:ERC protein 2 [Frankliniella fusca]|uniref:ERC protein 2 n=1 Tax=Frankliniella fusca TaxID=407009 RepID=A0AAE1LBF1_9NEOP|nr:ERC protein 2 [Frankliniella fusca]
MEYPSGQPLSSTYFVISFQRESRTSRSEGASGFELALATSALRVAYRPGGLVVLELVTYLFPMPLHVPPRPLWLCTSGRVVKQALLVRQLEEELRLRTRGPSVEMQQQMEILFQENDHLTRELSIMRETVKELEIRVETQKQTLAARDESIKKLLEMLQNKGVGEFSLILWAALNNWHQGIPKLRV